MGELDAGEDTYNGSRYFAALADNIGVSVDLMNFLIVQALSLILASIFRTYLHPSRVSTNIRHLFCISFGLLFGYFCFGQQVIHIAALPGICYIIICTSDPKFVQRTVAVVALLYLSCIHFHRQYYDYGSYSLDITGPLMIITQKVTSLAFSIHDGLTCKSEDLSKERRYHSVNKLPSVLEFFSYVLHFQGLMAGPLVFYQDYIQFIEGRYNPVMKTEPEGKFDLIVEPTPLKAVNNKIMASFLCAFIFMNFRKVFPIKTLKDDDFINNTNIIYKFWYIMMATTVVRFKYYYAWLAADAICNLSGLGFNGLDANGNAKWDLISNINIINFELAFNFRDSINCWNIGTNKWLRMLVYDRVPQMRSRNTIRTFLTFGLSALWHGFYPGYYVTFTTGAIVVMAARTARRTFRIYFQSSSILRTFYHALTFITTRIYMGYVTFPFVLLELQASVRVYLQLYMCLHVIALAIIFIPMFREATLKTKPQPKHIDKYLSSCTSLNPNGTYDVGNMRHAISNDLQKLKSHIKDKFEKEAQNIEDLLDKTVTGITELKGDFIKISDGVHGLIPNENVRKRMIDPTETESFLRNETGNFNCVAQNSNILPTVFSNVNGK